MLLQYAPRLKLLAKNKFLTQKVLWQYYLVVLLIMLVLEVLESFMVRMFGIFFLVSYLVNCKACQFL